jgi:hypothetical protein
VSIIEISFGGNNSMRFEYKKLMILAAVICLLALPVATAKANGSSDYPVILVHGLGADSSSAAFGNLKTYLENWFFDVEEMDFSDFSGHGLAKSKTKAKLSSLAVILKTKIDKVKAKYKVSKVNIVAHSYGGLIVHTYITGLATEARKSATFANDINRVLYIQTPFFGRKSVVNAGKLTSLINATDYSVFTDADTIRDDVEPGSEYAFKLFEALGGENPYEDVTENGVTAGFFVSDADVLLSEENGVIRGDVNSIDGLYEPSRVFAGYPHSDVFKGSAATKNYSIAYVDQMTDENFSAIASFIDGGMRWLAMGSSDLQDYSFLTVRVADEAGANGFNKKSVWIILKSAQSTSSLKTTNVKVNQRTNGYFNADTRTYYFTDLPAGDYEVRVKHPTQGTLIANYTFDPQNRTSLDYSPKEHAIEGGRGSISGLLALEEFTITEELKPWGVFEVSGVNTDGFFVEFEATGINPLNQVTDRNVLFEIINDNSPADVRHNGSRIRVCARGQFNRVPGPGRSHMNKIQINAVVDKNQNGHSDDGEWFEEKTHDPVGDWTGRMKVRMEVKTVDGEATFKFFVNDVYAPGVVTKSKPYFNPKFKIAVGGGFAEEMGKFINGNDNGIIYSFYEYRAPVGATFHYLRVGNIGQHK